MKMEERRRHVHIHFHLGAEQGYWKDISYEGSGVGNTFLNKMKMAEIRRQAHIRFKTECAIFILEQSNATGKILVKDFYNHISNHCNGR